MFADIPLAAAKTAVTGVAVKLPACSGFDEICTADCAKLLLVVESTACDGLCTCVVVDAPPTARVLVDVVGGKDLLVVGCAGGWKFWLLMLLPTEEVTEDADF